jgi:hypothetical protein
MALVRPKEGPLLPKQCWVRENLRRLSKGIKESCIWYFI